MNKAPVIETRELTKRYGEFEAVSSLDMFVPGQQITGFLGRNGAGKSTTIKMLLGATHPSSGAGMILGRPIDDPSGNRDARRRIAHVGEDKQLYAYLTVQELISFTKSFYDDWRPDVEYRLLKRYQLPPGRKIKQLSKGMRTKVALLLALSRRPDLLILDEPSEGLDPVSIEELLQDLVAEAAEGTTVFFSSHQITEVERIADRVCIIDRGKLAMELSLETLRREYRRISIGFDTQPIEGEFDRIDGIRQIQASGRQLTVLASHNLAGIMDRARCLDAVSVDVTPVSLREIFLETVKAE